MATDFETSFRANYLQSLIDKPVLPTERIWRAIVIGVFVGAGRSYPCEKETKVTMFMVLTRISDTYHRLHLGAV